MMLHHSKAAAVVLSLVILCSLASFCQAFPRFWRDETSREEQRHIAADAAARVVSSVLKALIQQNELQEGQCSLNDSFNLTGPGVDLDRSTETSTETISGRVIEKHFNFVCRNDYRLYVHKNGDSERLIENNNITYTCQVDAGASYQTSIGELGEPRCAIPCTVLQNIQNGTVSVDGNQPRPEGDTAEYSCNSGYQLNGTQNRTCGEDGQWSGQEPRCVRLCPVLVAPPNGAVNYSNREPGNVATYSCRDGYRLVGPKMRICARDQDGKWSGIHPVCEIIILCSLVDPIPNGDMSADKNPIPGRGYPVDTVVTYTCDNGYLLWGEDTRICLRSGEWDHPEPSCRPLIICPSDSLPITNGEFSPSSGLIRSPGGRQGYGVGTMVNYRCVSDHFKLRGESNIICLESGEWSHPPPRCAELSPPVIICSPDSLPITNGEFSPSRGLIRGTRGRLGYGVGTVVNYRCTLDRFELRGESSIICLESREWSPSPPRCVAVRCPKLRLSGNPRSVDKTRQQILRDKPRDYQRLLIETFFKKNIKGNLVPYDEGSTAKLTCIHIDHNGWTLMPNSPSVQTCVRNSTSGDLYWTKPGICVYRYSITRPALTSGTG